MFKSFFKGIARMFTIPRAVRSQIDLSPLGLMGKQVLIGDLTTALNSVIDKDVADKTVADALKAAVPHILSLVGLE